MLIKYLLMIDVDTGDERPLTRVFHVLVLKKIQHVLVSGFYGMDEVRYMYSWDNTKNREDNLRHVREEDAALRYFMDIKVIDAVRVPNEYRDQELRARALNPNEGVYADWDEVDPPYREYEWIVLMYGVDGNKFESQLEKFGLKDINLQLMENSPDSNLPKVRTVVTNNFSVHTANLISYNGKMIELEPQVRKIIAFIMERYKDDLYTSLEDIVDNCLSEEYLEKAARNPNLVPDYVRRCISRARSSFRVITGSEKAKDFFPNKRGAGYIFNP